MDNDSKLIKIEILFIRAVVTNVNETLNPSFMIQIFQSWSFLNGSYHNMLIIYLKSSLP